MEEAWAWPLRLVSADAAMVAPPRAEALPVLLVGVWWFAAGRPLMTAPSWPMDRSFAYATTNAERLAPAAMGWAAATLATIRYHPSAKGRHAPELRAALARLQHAGAIDHVGAGAWTLRRAWEHPARTAMSTVLRSEVDLVRGLAEEWADNTERQRRAALVSSVRS